ncbi:MAG TPA: hypothetical protein VLH83_07085, partial [Chthoniobacterales bacterium]|nr:hypothetical protein [Chthoniobacterales bacterium]
MFPLNTDTFPTTAAELGRQLNISLRGLFGLSRDPVEVREKSYPRLETMQVSLDGAVLPERLPAMPSIVGTPEPALTIDDFRVSASPLSIGPASVEFRLAAQGIELHRAVDRSGNLLLLLHNAANGRVEISVAVSDLEALIAEVAKTEASKHGVNIDTVQLSLRSRSSRSLAAEVRLRAKKMFVGA